QETRGAQTLPKILLLPPMLTGEEERTSPFALRFAGSYRPFVLNNGSDESKLSTKMAPPKADPPLTTNAPGGIWPARAATHIIGSTANARRCRHARRTCGNLSIADRKAGLRPVEQPTTCGAGAE